MLTSDGKQLVKAQSVERIGREALALMMERFEGAVGIEKFAVC